VQVGIRSCRIVDISVSGGTGAIRGTRTGIQIGFRRVHIVHAAQLYPFGITVEKQEVVYAVLHGNIPAIGVAVISIVGAGLFLTCLLHRIHGNAYAFGQRGLQLCGDGVPHHSDMKVFMRVVVTQVITVATGKQYQVCGKYTHNYFHYYSIFGFRLNRFSGQTKETFAFVGPK